MRSADRKQDQKLRKLLIGMEWICMVTLMVCICTLQGCIGGRQQTQQTGGEAENGTGQPETGGSEPDGTLHAEATQQEESGEADTEDTGNPAEAPAGEDVILSLAQIRAYNQAVIDTDGICVTDISVLPDTAEGGKVREMIEGLALPDKPYYDGGAFTEEIRNSLLAARETEYIEDGEIALQFAVAVCNTDIRSAPTKAVATDERGDFDYFQESMLDIGEPLAVYYTTQNGQWSFAVTPFCSGWIWTEDIAFCSRDEITAYYEREDIVVCLQNTELAGRQVRIGTAFVRGDVESGENGNGTVLLIPQRSGDGMLYYEVYRAEESLFENEILHIGYLPYNEENMERQLNRMLGLHYGWGDRDGDMDCSSTAQALYRCFGIRIARNTSWQRQMPGTHYDIGGLSRGEKIEILAGLPVGALIYMDGHVMMYAGTEAGVPMIIHNVTRYIAAEGEEETRIFACVKTPLSIINTAGVPYYEAIHTIVVIE